MIQIWFDGSITKNPGGSAYTGWVIKENDKVIKKGCSFVGSGEGMSSNVAEYMALVEALKYIIEIGKTAEKIEIYGDSDIVISRMSKKQTSNGLCKRYSELCLTYVLKLKDYSLSWIPREQNVEADEMSKELSGNSQSVFDIGKDLDKQYKLALSE